MKRSDLAGMPLLKFANIVIAAVLLAAGHAQAQLGLEIDGQGVVPSGELVQISYDPASPRRIIIRSIHADYRCSADPPENTPTIGADDFRLILDQLNAATEPEAIYRIAPPDQGGSIVQNLGDGMLAIQTSSDPAVQLTCAPFRKSFSSGSFEDPFSVTSEVPPSPFTAGGVLTVPITVKNVSRSRVATNIQTDIIWSTDPADATGVAAPTFSETVTEPAAGVSRWTIDVLWPQEARTIEADFDIGSQTPSGTVVITEAAVTGARNRDDSADLALGAAEPLIATVTIGEAEGDLSAGFQADDPVAGSGTGNLVLIYTIKNNAAIEMTDIVATLDPVSLPSSGVTQESETPSAGSVSNGQWDIPAIAAGATESVERVFTVAPEVAAGEQICSGLTIDAAAENLINTADDSASGCATVQREADLSSSLVVTQPSFQATEVNAGDTLIFAFLAESNGPSNASGVSSSMSLTVNSDASGSPDVAIDIGGSVSNDGSLSGSSSSVDFDVSGEIAPGSSATADIRIDVPGDTSDQAEICLDITSLSGAEPDPVPGNDLPSAADCVTVVNTGT